MSSRSSPLSSASSSPVFAASSLNLSTIPPHSSADPLAASPLSTSSSLSNPDDMAVPPSSPPDCMNDDEDARSDSSATTATIPLPSDAGSELSDLTEDEEDDEATMPGPPLGIRPSVGPIEVIHSGSTGPGDDEDSINQATPRPSSTHPEAISPLQSRSITPRSHKPNGKIRSGSRSPSLTPPPPPGATPADQPPQTTSVSPIGKRKRDENRVEAIAQLDQAARSPKPNGQGTTDEESFGEGRASKISVAAADGITAVKDDPLLAEDEEDLPMPERPDDPDAQAAFLEAMEAFDEPNMGEMDDQDKSDSHLGIDVDPPNVTEGDTVVQEVEVDHTLDPVIDQSGELAAVDQGGQSEVNEEAEGIQLEVEGMDKGAEDVDLHMGESALGEAEESAAVVESINPAIEAQVGPTDPAPDAIPEDVGTVAAAPVAPIAHAHSSHAPPPSQAAMRAMLKLELKFAALRDRLYIERMEEAAEEEEMILNGTHPALQQLHKTLATRRERLHELASRRHEQAMEELQVVRKAEQGAVWSWWTDERDRMHWGEFEQTWSKRRRLAREKNEIESVRWAKPVPYVGDPRFSKGFDWAARPTPARLSADEGSHDLQLMDHRQIQLSRHASRHNSPAPFPPLPNFPMNHQQQAAPSTQQRSDQFSSYAPGQTYAEALGTSGPTTASAQAYGENPRVVSNGVHPRSRMSTPGAGPSTTRPTQSAHTTTYGGAGLMDHLAYPRNATALGPTSSGSFSSMFQGSSQPSLAQSQSQTQSQQQQQQRREGRTVPTASTMFGPNAPASASATNSPITSTFPFNHPQTSTSVLQRTNSSQDPKSTATNGLTKDLKQENIEYGPWGSRVHVPMGFGLGFGLGGGGSTAMTGFGTLGAATTGAKNGSSSQGGATPGQDAGDKAEDRISSPVETNGTSADPVKHGIVTNGNGKPVDGADGMEVDPEETGTVIKDSSIFINGNQSALPYSQPSHTGQPILPQRSTPPGNVDAIVTSDPASQNPALQREKEQSKEKDLQSQRDREVEGQKEREREKERDRPRYPGLAEYLGQNGTNSLGMGLGRIGMGAGRLSPPRNGTTRSAFSGPPPVPTPSTQAISRS